MSIDPLSNFNRQYTGDYPFLTKQKREWSSTRPLEGIRILHNVPITRETLLKLEPLLVAGADLTVTHVVLPGLLPRNDCLDILHQSGIDTELDHGLLSGHYDIALDCCAQIPAMSGVSIGRGYVELTQSGTAGYRALDTALPVYSLDESRLKCLEAMFGTGEACRRAIKQFVTTDVSDKTFVLFGFGKVGYGIARYLSNDGARIIVCDKDLSVLERARATGYETLAPKPYTSLAHAVHAAFAVITATGEEGFFEKLFRPDEIGPSVRLINMGADDEYGVSYPPSRIEGEKAPLNFLLDAPTTIHFIDPVFAAHNACCLDILKGRDSGYCALPARLDLPWIEEWSRLHGIDVSPVFT